MKDIDELIAPDCSWQAKRIFWDEDLYELELERILAVAGCFSRTSR